MPVVKRKRMFRGPTRGNLFQTVDLGAGMGEYIFDRSQRFPKRRYGVVDYRLGTFDSIRGNIKEDRVIVRREIARTLREMIQHGTRTRHLNMDMPYPWDSPEHVGKSEKLFSFVLEAIPKVVLPNGKIFISSENRYTIQRMTEMAKQNGFSVRETKPIEPFFPARVSPVVLADLLQKMPRHYRTSVMRAFANVPIYRLEITYNLKKAFPKKEMRRRLSSVQKKMTSKE